MIPFAKKWYKKDDKGVDQLFGVDGMEHGAISGAVMLATLVVTFTLTRNVHITFIAGVVAWFIMRVVWFWIEHDQEVKMGSVRKNYPWNIFKWSKARWVDMVYPFIGDSIILGGFYKIFL